MVASDLFEAELLNLSSIVYWLYNVSMKRYLKKYASIKNYIAFLRRQPPHLQHIYAAVFAASITGLIAFSVLYIDYGFWHEQYIRKDLEVASTSTVVDKPVSDPESPGTMLFRFFGEAQTRLKEINVSGKETYTKESQ